MALWKTHLPSSLNSIPQIHITMSLPHSILLVLYFLDSFGVITYFNTLKAYPVQSLYGVSSASSILTINATQEGFFACSLEITFVDHWPIFPCLCPQSCFLRGHPWWKLVSRIFPQKLYSFLELSFINLIKFRSDLTSNYSDYTTFVWRVLLLFHFIEDNMLQNNQLNSLSQWWEWKF